MKQFDIFEARFKPARTDDLKPDAAALIGQTIQWQASYRIDEGPYVGDWACAPIERPAPFAWAPLRDLELV